MIGIYFSGTGNSRYALEIFIKKYGAIITGGLHLKMPDSIADEKVLKRPLEKNIMLVNNVNKKIKKAVSDIKK